MAPVNSVTRAETDLSVNRNQDLENLKASVLGRSARRCRAWGLITGLPGKGNKNILAGEPQMIVLEMAGTLKGVLKLGPLRPLDALGMRGRGGIWSSFSITYCYFFSLV